MSYLRDEFESVVAKLVIVAVKEGTGDAAEWGVLLDFRLRGNIRLGSEHETEIEWVERLW